MTPYLQLLLNRKKREPMDERLPNGVSSIAPPSIQMSERSNPTATSIPLTQPTAPEQPVPEATIPLGKATMNRPYKPFTPDAPIASADPWVQRIEEDRQALITAQRKPRSKWKDIGEGLATWAASGVGIPLQRILHPRGSETQQAERALGRDVMLQKASGEAQEQRASIALRGATARKIDADLRDAINNPKISPQGKAEIAAVQQGLKAFEGQAPTPENDARYAELRALAAKHGIPLPATYGPKATAAPNRDFTIGNKRVRMVDGKPVVIYEAPEEPEVPDTTGNWTTLEAGFRNNASAALKAAQKAEQDAKAYIASKGEGFDPTKDANVAALTAESRRQREFAEKQTEKADQVAIKKTEAAAGDAKARSRKPFRGGGKKYVAPKVSVDRLNDLMR